MHKTIIALLLALFTAAGLSAVPAGVVYAEGEANIRFRSGSQREAAIGYILNTGDTLKTGTDGLVELDQKGVRLPLALNTVFTLLEKKRGGKPDDVDGSALIVVDRGAVTVEAEGQSVALEPEEGVEVRPGQPPGDKFKVHRNQVDYSKWNEEKMALMLQDPLSAVTSIGERPDSYIRDIEEYWALCRQYKEQLDTERQTMVAIDTTQGKEQARRYNLETIMPLAALSLRRFAGGRLYLFLKSQSFAQPDEPLYREFLDSYCRFLETYERSIVPHLVEADI